MCARSITDQPPQHHNTTKIQLDTSNHTHPHHKNKSFTRNRNQITSRNHSLLALLCLPRTLYQITRVQQQ